jgi:hypothetical protein
LPNLMRGWHDLTARTLLCSWIYTPRSTCPAMDTTIHIPNNGPSVNTLLVCPLYACVRRWVAVRVPVDIHFTSAAPLKLSLCCAVLCTAVCCGVGCRHCPTCPCGAHWNTCPLHSATCPPCTRWRRSRAFVSSLAPSSRTLSACGWQQIVCGSCLSGSWMRSCKVRGLPTPCWHDSMS